MNVDETLMKMMRADEAYGESHCGDCGKKKTNPRADLCYKCAHKKASKMGHLLTKQHYDSY